MSNHGANPFAGLSELSTASTHDSVLPRSELVVTWRAERSASALRGPEDPAQFRRALAQLKSGRAFATTTSLLRRATELSRAPHVTSQALRELLQGRPSLQRPLLAVASSAHYSRGERIASLEQALLRLGPRTLALQLQALAARGFAIGQNPVARREIMDGLATGYAVALVSSELARITRRALPSEAFTAGLFHDIRHTFWLVAQAMAPHGDAPVSGDGRAPSGDAYDEPELAQEVCHALGWSRAVTDLALTSATSATGRLVGMAIWIARKLLRPLPGADEAQLEPEGRALGVSEELWRSALSFSVSLRQLVASYGAVA